jgi:hypothetical protein
MKRSVRSLSLLLIFLNNVRVFAQGRRAYGEWRRGSWCLTSDRGKMLQRLKEFQRFKLELLKILCDDGWEMFRIFEENLKVVKLWWVASEDLKRETKWRATVLSRKRTAFLLFWICWNLRADSRKRRKIWNWRDQKL